MPRYFIEVAYKGTRYSGFQVQQNADTIQAQVEKALFTLHRTSYALTGSSRTDAGVHAQQNFFHFDADAVHAQAVYKLNAILPPAIVVKRITQMPPAAHCRFDAVSRAYLYHIYQFKNPFLNEVAWYYPYTLDGGIMREAAAFVKEQRDFQSFSKAHTQVANFNCNLIESAWHFEKGELWYQVSANRFLRGMVRMLTASMLNLGRGKTGFEEYRQHFTADKACAVAAPAHGLHLTQVAYPANYFVDSGAG